MVPCSDVPEQAADEFELPCVEAILAGSLALMTGHAQATCARQRQALGAKIASNIGLLAEHPHLSAAFRQALSQLRVHWERLQESPCSPQTDTRLWHSPPGALQ